MTRQQEITRLLKKEADGSITAQDYVKLTKLLELDALNQPDGNALSLEFSVSKPGRQTEVG